MQSSKASKKTKIAEEASTSVPEMSTMGESTATPRTSRSSKLKKETSEMGPAKHRKSGSAEAGIETSPARKKGSEASVIDSVGVMTTATASPNAGLRSSEISPSHEEIAKLAHSYWVSRGHTHGSQEEDWLRAEHELKSRR
ncbi:MAG: DUF2934 domain-containing protein [Acidobacteriaceae bacterium]|nr:DUF2934 domain-containing protein [Acidobacteriaceae bacterium]